MWLLPLFTVRPGAIEPSQGTTQPIHFLNLVELVQVACQSPAILVLLHPSGYFSDRWSILLNHPFNRIERHMLAGEWTELGRLMSRFLSQINSYDNFIDYNFYGYNRRN